RGEGSREHGRARLYRRCSSPPLRALAGWRGRLRYLAVRPPGHRMSRPTLRPVLPALALAAALLAGPGSAAAATLETIVEEVGFDADAAQRLQAGEILSKRLEESQEGTELAISVVGLFAASLEEAHASVVRGDAFEVDRNLLAHGELRAWPPD